MTGSTACEEVSAITHGYFPKSSMETIIVPVVKDNKGVLTVLEICMDSFCLSGGWCTC